METQLVAGRTISLPAANFTAISTKIIKQKQKSVGSKNRAEVKCQGSKVRLDLAVASNASGLEALDALHLEGGANQVANGNVGTTPSSWHHQACLEATDTR